MDLITQALLSPTSGPIWGLIGVFGTVGANLWINRKKTLADTSAAALNAVNQGQKQLTDSLFQQLQIMGEDMAAMKLHVKDCEDRHDTAMRRIIELERLVTHKG